jgi:beta-glucosidase
VAVSFIVRNDGTRRGSEVAQLYVDEPRAAGEPPKQLQGYERVFLWPRHSKRVTMTLSSRAFAYWDSASARWRVTPGLDRILVGASSRDIRLRGFVHR